MSSNWPSATSTVDVHHRRAPSAVASGQGLIDAQRLHRSHMVTVGSQQRRAPGEHRPVRRVPVTAQLGGHIGDGARVAAHRHRRPASRPRRQRRPGRRDPLIGLGERPHRAARRRTAPPSLVPHEAHRAPARRQTHQTRRNRTLRPHRVTTAPTGRQRVRTCKAKGPRGASSTPRTSTSPRPTIHSQIRVRFSSIGGLLHWCTSNPILEASTPATRTDSPLNSE